MWKTAFKKTSDFLKAVCLPRILPGLFLDILSQIMNLPQIFLVEKLL